MSELPSKKVLASKTSCRAVREGPSAVLNRVVSAPAPPFSCRSVALVQVVFAVAGERRSPPPPP